MPTPPASERLHTPTLTVITGGMFAGKSEETQRRMRREQIAKRPFVLLRPSLDTRTREAISHAGRRMRGVRAHVVDVDSARRPHVPSGVRTVFIDEGQFFGPALTAWCDAWLARGLDVVVAGLDTDWTGAPYETMGALLAMCDVPVKLTAVCKCGGNARHSHRLAAGTARVQVGAAHEYEALCRTCYREARAHE